MAQKKTPAKKAPAKAPAKKAPAKKPAAKKASVKKAAPDYSGMTLEELAIESGMAPERARESVAVLLMLGDTMEGIREHLLAKLAKRNAKEAAKTAPAAKKTPAKKAPAKKTAKKTPAVATAAETATIALPGGVELVMVRIPGKDYWMGKFQVTQAQWESVTGTNPSDFKGPENPVENVSWDDCQVFLETLNAQPAAKASGLVFRLPEEAEWQYACRAGATEYWTSAYCKLADGTEITEETLDEVAWFDKNSDEMTHPVGQKKPNAFGLYDMYGNVWEWTSTADGEDRVNHGGSWLDPAWDCESLIRGRGSPSYRDNDLGFRLCADRRAD